MGQSRGVEQERLAVEEQRSGQLAALERAGQRAEQRGLAAACSRHHRRHNGNGISR